MNIIFFGLLSQFFYGDTSRQGPTLVESHVRTLMEAFSWQLFVTLVSFTIAWLVAGKMTLAAEMRYS